ncbi:hypothetical protein chiPu_0022242 [Chiloscyllium punctatum]|uniref:Beta/gamma crystallin 'Greek key' domain-containing protein n=1 Tax=Chiloscyllium punctatum TaxID=137246 RepID=A0A401RFI0_CHIPU|nr:hypothetical protein [Chiloscyllium punctatum]
MNEITLYAQEDFTGRRVTFQSSTPDLGVDFFNDTARSLKVVGNPWMAYTGKDYTGDSKEFTEGEYEKLGLFDRKINSIQLLSADTVTPPSECQKTVTSRKI